MSLLTVIEDGITGIEHLAGSKDIGDVIKVVETTFGMMQKMPDAVREAVSEGGTGGTVSEGGTGGTLAADVAALKADVAALKAELHPQGPAHA